jgi:hypothetical protein
MRKRQIAAVVSKKSVYGPDTDVAYWRAQPYRVRLAALEEIRQEYHHWKGDAQPGLQRIYRIIKR